MVPNESLIFGRGFVKILGPRKLMGKYAICKVVGKGTARIKMQVGIVIKLSNV